MEITKKRAVLLFLIILFIGFFLRIYNLDKENLWHDEAFSVEHVRLDLKSMITTVSIAKVYDVHPPLYYFLLHFWISIFGESEYSVRFLSVIFGMMGIIMVYKIGSLIFDREVGVWSSLLLALSSFHIFYSQEARMYSLVVFETLVSFYFLLKLLKTGKFRYIFGYMLSSIALMYTHAYSFFVILAQNIYILTLLFFSKEPFWLNLKKWIIFQSLLIILYLPWLGIIINKTINIQNGYWIPMPTINTVISSFKDYSGSEELLIFFSLLFFSVVIKSVTTENIIKSGKFLSYNNKSYLLLIWLIIPIAFPFIISQFLQPIYHTRYTIVASLAFYLLISKVIRDLQHKYIRLFVISIIVLFSLFNLFEYYSTVKKEPWKVAASFVDNNAKRGDLLLFNLGHIQEPFDYYSRRTELARKVFPKDITYKNADKKVAKKLAAIKNYRRIWVILLYNRDHKLIRDKLNKTYNSLYCRRYFTGSRIYARKPFNIEVCLFEKTNSKKSTSSL